MKQPPNKFGKDNITSVQGVAYKEERSTTIEDTVMGIDAAVQAAANADYVLLCIGENSYTETPGNLVDLSLSDNQLALANAMIKTGKPVIFILNEGRPRIINRIEPGAAAVLDVYLPGNYGADALADILTGDVNPSGKLPITYPRYTNALVSYIHKPSEGDSNPQGGMFQTTMALWVWIIVHKFCLQQSCPSIKIVLALTKLATITVTVNNTGSRDGKEVLCSCLFPTSSASFNSRCKKIKRI